MKGQGRDCFQPYRQEAHIDKRHSLLLRHQQWSHMAHFRRANSTEKLETAPQTFTIAVLASYTTFRLVVREVGNSDAADCNSVQVVTWALVFYESPTEVSKAIIILYTHRAHNYSPSTWETESEDDTCLQRLSFHVTCGKINFITMFLPFFRQKIYSIASMGPNFTFKQ